MGEAFLHGNGSGGSSGNALNFKVVGGTTQPASASENTIWINTSAEITSWIFSAAEPSSPTAGMVWIKVGTASNVEFNALKKNVIEVYPVAVKQYINATWADAPAQIYQNGAWADWITYLYNSGDICSEVTGGWNHIVYDSDNEESSSLQSDSIYVYALEPSTDRVSGAGRITVNTIDLTNVNFLRAIGNCTQGGYKSGTSGAVGIIGMRVTSSVEYDADIVADVQFKNTGDFDLSLDVSNLSGSYYIIVYAYSYSNKAAEGTFTQIWCE